MREILVHGMGRTPAAMLILAARLRAAGLHPDLFAYSAALEGWEGCVGRLRGFIDRRAAGTDFVVVGHSLGTVLLRAASHPGASTGCSRGRWGRSWPASPSWMRCRCRRCTPSS